MQTVPAPTVQERSPAPDAQLVSRAAAGDQGAFAEIYDRHAGLAYSVALRVLQRPDRAEDVVQEAFLNLWRGAAGFDSQRGNVRSWLMTMVRNRAIDQLRGRAGHERDERSLSIDVPALSGSDPYEQAVLADERRLIKSALQGLPKQQRRTVELAYFRGLSHREIAADMEVPLSTVKGRMRLALVKLADMTTALAPLAQAG